MQQDASWSDAKKYADMPGFRTPFKSQAEPAGKWVCQWLIF